MTHPEELLAGYVDGTLGTDERDVVDAHLASCAACREEVELARAAVTALAALDEVPVPFGVTGPVLAEAGRRFERRRTAVWGRLQWVAGAAAAAAVVLVIALGSNLGGDDDAGQVASGAATGATGAAAQEGAAAPRAFAGLERQVDVNYDDAGVEGLAVETATKRTTLSASAGAEAGTTGATGATGGDATGEEALDAITYTGPGAALRCLRAAEAPVDDPRDTLVRLIEAKYKGDPAYLAVFLEGPGAGQPADRVVVWVVGKTSCQILSGVQQRL
jgi:predicted anti-sigma-YlaC factor YlaD